MIEFYKEDNKLILSYTPERDAEENWVVKVLEDDEDITLKKTFSFSKEHVFTWPSAKIDEDDPFGTEVPPIAFIFGIKQGNYYKIKKGVLTEQFDIYIHQDFQLDDTYFVADSNISIFRTLQALVSSDIYLGGDHLSAITRQGFSELIANFPTPYEKKKYVEARISAVLREHFGDLKDGEKAFHRYMNRKISKTGSDLKKVFQEFELKKYETILDKLENMLLTEDEYSEKRWQEEILQILLLIYPKYIYVFREVPIKDKNIQERSLDYLVVDSNGYTDIVEIKRPFGKCIITENKYRNNFIPLRELSGTIMQIEKYIFYLNRWGIDGERFLTEKYKQALPESFEIKITNPSGIIIMGRGNNLSTEQRADFEVVKRKYKNVVDIITYDNLLERLRCTIEQIRKL